MIEKKKENYLDSTTSLYSPSSLPVYQGLGEDKTMKKRKSFKDCLAATMNHGMYFSSLSFIFPFIHLSIQKLTCKNTLGAPSVVSAL